MKKTEWVLRELLYQALEKKNRVVTQAGLAKALRVSLSTVNVVITLLNSMGAVEVTPRNLHVIVFEGRVHYYEGNTMAEVTFCSRVIGQMGVKKLMLTNASGAINPNFARGQLMLISDHINLLGANPLSGPNEDRWGPRFLDQTNVYDPELRKKLREAGEYCGIHLVEGVYAAMAGPTYETPAEIRFLRAIGADAVGMSTVPEAIVARHMGVSVAGISMLANSAAGTTGKPINHAEVLDMATQMNADLGMLLQRYLDTYEP